MEKTIGFIVLRHVNNKQTNNYWQRCVSQIQIFYPNSKILLIDDNSNKEFVSPCNYNNVTIVNSEYPKRGELLPYIYYLKYKLFDCAVILHDSVFIQQKIDFYTENWKPIWTFPHSTNIESHRRDIRKMLKKYNLEKKYESSDCNGIFGVMTVISHDFLLQLNAQYDLSALIDCVGCRYDRCALERVFGFLHEITIGIDESKKCSILGNIIEYCEWGIKFEDSDKYSNLPILKVWTGR